MIFGNPLHAMLTCALLLCGLIATAADDRPSSGRKSRRAEPEMPPKVKVTPPSGWLDDRDKAIKTAEEKKLPILVLASGTNWCGPCMALRSNVLERSAFKKLLRDQVVPYYLHIPPFAQWTPAYREQLRRDYPGFGSRIRGVPAIFFTDSEFNLLSPRLSNNPPRNAKAFDNFKQQIAEARQLLVLRNESKGSADSADPQSDNPAQSQTFPVLKILDCSPVPGPDGTIRVKWGEPVTVRIEYQIPPGKIAYLSLQPRYGEGGFWRNDGSRRCIGQGVYEGKVTFRSPGSYRNIQVSIQMPNIPMRFFRRPLPIITAGYELPEDLTIAPTPAVKGKLLTRNLPLADQARLELYRGLEAMPNFHSRSWEPTPAALQRFLGKRCKLDFPPDSTCRYDPRSNLLMLTNTAENLDKAARFTQSDHASAVSQQAVWTQLESLMIPRKELQQIRLPLRDFLTTLAQHYADRTPIRHIELDNGLTNQTVIVFSPGPDLSMIRVLTAVAEQTGYLPVLSGDRVRFVKPAYYDTAQYENP